MSTGQGVEGVDVVWLLADGCFEHFGGARGMAGTGGGHAGVVKQIEIRGVGLQRDFEECLGPLELLCVRERYCSGEGEVRIASGVLLEARGERVTLGAAAGHVERLEAYQQ